MAHIKAIRFETVGKNEGCCCDRCGQYIKNIWTVSYKEGESFHYGIDCWNQIRRTGLNEAGIKAMNKIMKTIQMYDEWLAKYTSGEYTEETDPSWEQEKERNDTYEEYRDWMINEFFPYRIGEAQKGLAKFRKINFEA